MPLRYCAFLAIACCAASLHAEIEGIYTGLKPDAAPALMHAAKAGGFTLKSGSLDQIAGKIVVLEANANAEISDDQAARLGDFVRNGGSLLLSVDEKPGRTPMHLAFMLPTTAWMVSGSGSARDAATVTEADTSLFRGTATEVHGLRLPFFFELRPFHAVERGQARYDVYDRPAPWVAYNGPNDKTPRLPPNSDWWSRPLLNRDWQVRARLDDLTSSPLLLTGRYGAGRVAVFASSFEALPDSPRAQSFCQVALQWLIVDLPHTDTPAVRLPKPEMAAKPGSSTFQLTLRNPELTELKVQVVARLASWEGAPLGDVLRDTTLPAHSTTTLDLPLPGNGLTAYAELADRDAFQVRVGILSADGGTLLSEARADLDRRAAVEVSIATEEVRSIKPAFPDIPEPAKPYRMGLPVGNYAYAPGQTVNAKVTINHGLRNLASLATVSDETTPNNATLMALTDDAAMVERRPVATEPTGWGFYEGSAKAENRLTFSFEKPVTLADVVLMGAGDRYRNQHDYNPGSVIVEVDGKEVARSNDLSSRFLAEYGLVKVPFPVTSGKVLRLTFSGQRKGSPLRLGEVRIEGSTQAEPASVEGTLDVAWHDVLHGTVTSLISHQPVKSSPLARIEVPITFKLPEGKEANFYRLEATLTINGLTESCSTPILSVQPAHPLIALSKLKPDNAAQVGLIVTRGFREFFDNAVGTAELGDGWGQPDDLVWAYARGMKQLSASARTRADRLYVSESDMRHYSTPWRPFGNGEEFYEVSTLGLVARMKRDPHWNNSDIVVLGHSDRWDAGPEVGAMHAWQDFEGFDVWLRAHGLPGLKGKTRRELTDEIEHRLRGPWEAWHQERYARSVHTLREAFAKEGKHVVITAQGVSLIATPEDAAVVGEVVRGMSDDHTWGMLEENLPFTTGRQMGAVAFNPSLAMSTLNQWGYVSNALNNPQWHEPVSTTEPARRVMYDRAFRGMIRPDGSYTSIHVYGYNENAGYAFTLNEPEFNAWHRVQEKHSLLTPDSPIGAGVVITTAHLQSLENRRFTCGGGSELPEPRAVARTVQRLQEAGISVAFSANAGTLERWSGTAPLILINIEQCSAAELATLKKLAARGVPLAAFCGVQPLPPAVADLFAGCTTMGTIADHPLLAGPNQILIPIAAADLSSEQARRISVLLREHLHIPITFPPGTAGYGFTSNGRSFVVVEDWLEEGRVVPLRIHARANAQTLHAADATDHRALTATREGDDWIIQVPLRPGDAALVTFEELP